MTTSGTSRRWLQAGTLAAGLGAALAAGTGTACADDAAASPSDSRPSASSHSEKHSARGHAAQQSGKVATSSRAAQGTKPAPAASARARISGASAPAVRARPTRPRPGAEPISVPTAPAYPAALTEPVTWRSIARDVRRWVGLSPVPAGSPVPPTPVPGPVEQLWFGVRRFEYTFFNDNPTARPVQLAQDTDGTITGSVRAVDPDGDKITYSFTDPLHGTVTIADDGTYTYVPDAQWAHAGGGADSFTVTVSDELGNPWHLHGLADLLGLTKPAEVKANVTVAQVNRAPAVPETVTGSDPDPHGVVTGQITAKDVDGDQVSFSLLDEPWLGQLTLNTETGKFSYQPSREARHAVAKGEPDIDTFTVRTVDALGASAVTKVTVKVSPYNEAPAIPATPPKIITSVGNAIFFPGVVDPDGDEMTVIAYVAPADSQKGVVQTNSDGSFTYLSTVASAAAGGDVRVIVRAFDEVGADSSRTITLSLPTYVTLEGTLVFDNSNSDINAGIPIDDGFKLTLRGVEQLLADGGTSVVRPATGADGTPLKWFSDDGTQQQYSINQTGSVSGSGSRTEVFLQSSLVAIFFLDGA